MAEKFWNQLTLQEKAAYTGHDFNDHILRMLKDQPQRTETYTTNVVYETDVYLRHIHRLDIVFKNCYFLRNVVIDGETRGKVTFDNCVFQTDVIINSSPQHVLSIDLINAVVAKELLIKSGKFEQFSASFKKANAVKINKGEFGRAALGYWGSHCVIDQLFINANQIFGDVEITKSDIHRLHLSGINKGNIYIESCKINSFTGYQFRNEQKFQMHNVQPLFISDKASEFVLVDCNLSKTEFFEVDFTAFDQMIVHDSFLADAIFINVDWPAYIETFGGRYISEEEKTPPTSLSRLKKQRDVYRQIKYLMGKQGDAVGEHFFHSREMSVYNKSLDWKLRVLPTKVILGMSKLLSNYGQSLWRPAFFLFTGIGLLYFCMIYFFEYNGYRISHDSTANYESIGNVVAEFLRLCNPLHANEVTLKGGLLILDLAARVWSSYMVYNIIRATRRFIK